MILVKRSKKTIIPLSSIQGLSLAEILSTLFDIKQKSGASVKDYVDKVKKAAKVGNISDKAIHGALISELLVTSNVMF